MKCSPLEKMLPTNDMIVGVNVVVLYRERCRLYFHFLKCNAITFCGKMQ